MRPLRVVVAAACVVFLVALVLEIRRSGGFTTDPEASLLGVAAVAGAMVAGLAWWSLGRGGPIGPLLVAGGVVAGASGFTLSESDLPFTAAWLISAVSPLFVAHALLAYPTGVLSRSRSTFVFLYALPFTLGTGWLLMWNPQRPRFRDGGGARDLPDNLALVIDGGAAAPFFEIGWSALRIVVGVVVAVVLVRRQRRASVPARRDLAAVTSAGLVWAVAQIPAAAVQSWSADWHQDPSAILVLAEFGLPLTGLLLVALAVLYVGLLRQRLARAGVADLVIELDAPAGSQRLEEALRRSLGDPGAEVLFWREPGGWVGPDGAPAALPPDTDGSRAVTVVAREGRHVAAIVHDPALRSEPALVEAAAAAASLALEKERLHALTLAQLSEVRSSRARIVAAADDARRRIERDLHDGAQQRLVSLGLALGLARAQLSQAAPVALDAQLRALDAGIHQALAELRDLAHGIHPAALTEQGLAGALASLADDAPLPVEVTAVPSGRLPAPVEAAAWFVASEAVANTAKHAAATRVSIAARLHGDELELEVADDGVGGAGVDRGSGLLGLRDRVEALDGSLAIDSPVGAGTRLRARIPIRELP